MKFVSTRGQAPQLGFCEVLLAGLAADGGLYLPQTWPQVSAEEIAGYANKPFADVAFDVISRFTGGDIPDGDLRAIVEGAYATFRHPSTTPLVELEPGHFILELFHGPTLAFKDVAMQFLARAMDYALAKKGGRATIVGATSGDTGSAAIEAFRGRDNIDIFILHPEGRTSEVQRKQMTSVLDDNVHNIALKGTFDDCQHAVKAMFNNQAFRNAAHLSGVNSINWGRIVAQITYYFTAAAALGAPHRKISFTVPSGNFGDIFAGYCAKRMGLPVEKLIVATNANDILRRTFETGAYETKGVHPTMSPSMDIQVSSNFERLLFEVLDRDAEAVERLMNSLQQSGGFTLEGTALVKLQEGFAAGTADEVQTSAAMATAHKASGYLADPHTAVGIHVARQNLSGKTPMVTLSTAHPAKFPAPVADATGVEPALPVWLADLMDRPERFETVENDQKKVEDFIRERSRAWEE